MVEDVLTPWTITQPPSSPRLRAYAYRLKERGRENYDGHAHTSSSVPNGLDLKTVTQKISQYYRHGWCKRSINERLQAPRCSHEYRHQLCCLQLPRCYFISHNRNNLARQIRSSRNPPKPSLRSRRPDHCVRPPQRRRTIAHRICFVGIDLFFDSRTIDEALRVCFHRDEAAQISE